MVAGTGNRWAREDAEKWPGEQEGGKEPWLSNQTEHLNHLGSCSNTDSRAPPRGVGASAAAPFAEPFTQTRRGAAACPRSPAPLIPLEDILFAPFHRRENRDSRGAAMFYLVLRDRRRPERRLEPGLCPRGTRGGRAHPKQTSDAPFSFPCCCLKLTFGTQDSERSWGEDWEEASKKLGTKETEGTSHLENGCDK